MGYYTLHRIRIINEYNTKNNLEKLKEHIQKISGYNFYLSGSVLKDYHNKEFDDGTKWYQCENNMKAVSRYVPDFEIQVREKEKKEKFGKWFLKMGSLIIMMILLSFLILILVLFLILDLKMIQIHILILRKKYM